MNIKPSTWKGKKDQGKPGAPGTEKKKEVDEWNPDVASVGVDLDEEEQNMTTLRSEQNEGNQSPVTSNYHPEQPLLNKAPLTNKLNRIARKKGLKTINDDAVEYMTQAVQIRMRSIIEDLIRIAQYRNDSTDQSLVDKSQINKVMTSDEAYRFHIREVSEKKHIIEQERQKSEEEQKRLALEKEKEEEKQRRKKRRQQEEDAAARAQSTNAAVDMAIRASAPNPRSKRRERAERDEDGNGSHSRRDEDGNERPSKRRRDGIKIIGKDVVLFMEQDALLRKSKVLYSIASKIKTKEL
ncbi:transcription initiation factor TFIID subunit 4 [Acrasis kona]|uniref:Transcription initiation factor TFIID subunit 4 n=1 Tax=Acrasis kona TaxID=1008807 RepID=A0AAW2YZA3_9EUKA